jgi:hypothetical protein
MQSRRSDAMVHPGAANSSGSRRWDISTLREVLVHRNSATHGWEANAIRVSLAALELAQIRRRQITVEMFSPAKFCQNCNSQAQVFVKPHDICATCWSLSILSSAVTEIKEMMTALSGIRTPA